MKLKIILILVFLNLSISFQLNAQLELSSHWGGGNCKAVALNNTHAFICFGSYLYAVGLENYEITGIKVLPDAVIEMVVEGNVAYVSTSSQQLWVVDISNPANMKVIQKVDDGYYRSLKIENNRLYGACSSQGLAVFDITNTMQPKLLGKLDIASFVYDVVPNGNYIYCAAVFDGLVIIDQTNQQELKELGKVATSKNIYGIIKHNNHAYAFSDANSAMEIFDISNAQLPVLKNSISDEDGIIQLQMLGNTMYVGGYDDGIRKFSLADPENPTEIGRQNLEIIRKFALNNKALCGITDNDGAFLYPLENGEFKENTAHYELDFSTLKMHSVGGTSLYFPLTFANESSKVRIIDISNPLSPEDYGDFVLKVSDIENKGDVAYFSISNSSGYFVDVKDVSDPNHPKDITKYKLPSDFPGLSVYNDLLIAHGIVTHYEKGIEVIDISDSIAPVKHSFVEHTSSFQQVGITDSALFAVDTKKQLFRIDIRDRKNPVLENPPLLSDSIAGCWTRNDVGYFTDTEDTLHIYDISDPFNPVIKNKIRNNRLLTQPCFYGNVAYATGVRGIDVYDFSDPFYPSREGFADVPGYFTSPVVVGDKLVVLKVIHENKLTVFDLSILTKPTLVGEFAPMGENNRIAVSGDTVFVANNFGGLQIIDMANDTARVLGVHHIKGEVKDVEVQGDYAYLAVFDEGLQIVDISDLTNIKTVGTYQTEDIDWGAIDVHVEGNRAYIAGGSFGLRIIDISVKENPREIGADGDVRGIYRTFLNDGQLFCSTQDKGVYVYDVDPPQNPTIVGQYDTPGRTFDISVRNDTAFVADGRNSFRILDVSDPANISEITNHSLYPGDAMAIDVFENYVFVAGSYMGLYMFDISDINNITQMTRFFALGGDFTDVYVENGNVFACCKNTGVYKLSTSLFTSCADSTTLTAEICEGETYQFGSQVVSDPGRYIEVLKTTDDCDSIIILNLKVNPTYYHTFEVEICEGESYKNQTTTGQYVENLISINGCDSVVVTHLTVHSVPTVDLTVNGNTLSSNKKFETYQWYNSFGAISNATDSVYHISATGVYYLEVTTTEGCVARSEDVSVTYTSVEGLKSSELNLTAFPNPFEDEIQFAFQLKQSGKLKIVVYNILGEQIDVKNFGIRETGSNELSYPSAHLPTGSFITKLFLNNEILGSVLLIKQER